MKTIHQLCYFLLLGFLIVNWSSCKEEEMLELRVLEQDYVALIDALYFNQLELSHLAFADLQQEIERWAHLEAVANVDMEHHLRQAECAFQDGAYALSLNKLELTKTLLDRATYEVYLAEPATFKRFYVGNFYNFFANWQDVNAVINDPMLCLLDWPELRDRVEDMQYEWSLLEDVLPDAAIYKWEPSRVDRFLELKTELGLAINFFASSLDSGSQTEVIIASSAIRMTLWPLLRMFGPQPTI